ncbi:MAG: hypothetical protein ACREN2_09140 [Candidatus Dormibacteria bacterium]
MSGRVLTLEEVRFINLVATRRVAHDAAATPAPPHTTLEQVSSEQPAQRAAQLGAALTRPGALDEVALPSALLAVLCQLHRDGFRLVAPQGAVAGMVRGLSSGRVGLSDFAAWVEDRSIPD